jgi:hypothetical protein
MPQRVGDLLLRELAPVLRPGTEAARASRAVALVRERLGADLAVLARHPTVAAPRLLAPAPAGLAALYDLAPHDPSPWAAAFGGADVLVGDTRHDRRFPVVSAAVLGLGIRSYRIVGFVSPRRARVSLTLLAGTAGSLDADPLEAQLVLDCVGTMITADDVAGHLRAAMTTREVIGQAQGIYMERFGLSAEESMEFLKRRSQDLQVKVRDLAALVVDQRSRPAYDVRGADRPAGEPGDEPGDEHGDEPGDEPAR